MRASENDSKIAANVVPMSAWRAAFTVCPCPISSPSAMRSTGCELTALPADVRARLYQSYLDEALTIANSVDEQDVDRGELLDGKFGKLQFFAA